jgi:hypothetical protein
MKAKEFIPASKPRNFVAKNQKTAGAGAHKDKKRAEKQGDVKHKQKQFEQGVAEVSQQTLQSYRKKAAKEKNDAMDIVNRDDVDDATWAKNVNKASQRKDGIAAANKRLGVAERVRDPEDWDEGNTEPPNNFAVYINGKKWKVFKGRGQFADDYKEREHYRQLQNWAQAKSQSTGKKWEVSVTGEAPTA